DADGGGRVVVVVGVGCNDDDDGVVGVAAVGDRDGGVEVRRVAVEGGDEVVLAVVMMVEMIMVEVVCQSMAGIWLEYGRLKGRRRKI
ncbi:hypothetical protein Tco_0274941, partial [Tanacetum coccineum]